MRATSRREDGADRGRAQRKKAQPTSEEEARRALAESTKLYYRIGEVSELTGVKAHVLRYWETEFRWMAPPKSRSKQRLYRKRDIEFVWLLKKLLWDQRYTIAGARQRIQELGLDEALARSADPELRGDLGAAPPLQAEPAGVPGAGALALASSTDGAGGTDGSAARAETGSPDWVGIRVALESMQGELLALRGALQQGL